MPRHHTIGFAVAFALACSRVADAQTPPAPTPQMPMSRFVTDLITAGGLVDSTRANNLPAFLAASELGRVPAELNQSIAMQITTFPFDRGLDTSAPGALDVPSHSALGPGFVVHAGAIGRGRLSASFNYQNTSFGSLDGTSFDSGQMGFVFKPPAAVQSAFGQNVLQEQMALRLEREAATFSLVYGATNRLDLGLAIPFVRVDMEGRLQSNLYRGAGASPDRYYFDVYPGTPAQAPGCSTSSFDIVAVNRAEQPPVNFVNAPYDMVQLATRTVYRRCTANGLGDVVAHGRFRLTPSAAAHALAVSLDAELPTGNADQLLGTGTTRTTAAVIWSRQTGRVAPHATVGYTHSFGKTTSQFNTVLPDGTPSPNPISLRLPDEINFSVGADVVFFRRLTTTLNLYGRRLQDLHRFSVDGSTAAAFGPGESPVPGTLTVEDGTGLDLLLGVIGAQVSLTDRTLLKGNVIVPAFGDGMKPRFGVGVGVGFRY
jgi:hypothetical protein